jgi:hypothetical protein
MNTTLLRMKVVEELDLFPEESLPDLYRFMHDFRLRRRTATTANSTKTVSMPLSLVNSNVELSPGSDVDTEESAAKLLQMTIAARDPLFLADLQETQTAFSSIDADWWEPAA